MIPYFAYQRKRFFDFCLEKFYFFHTFCVQRGHLAPKQAGGAEKCVLPIWQTRCLARHRGRCLPGKACHSKARRGHNNAGGDRARRAGEAPRTVCHAGNAQRQRAGRAGRCGDRDLCGRTARPAAAGRAGVGAGHREPAGHGGCPRPAHGAEDFSHHGAAAHAAGKRHPAGGAIAPGVPASTGLTLRQLAGAMVEAVRPAARP